MWLEAILSKEDLVALLPQLAPVQVRLPDGGDLLIHDPASVTLVTGEGLRFVCEAKLHWPVLGIRMPFTIHALEVMVRPHIAATDARNELVFPLEIEHADFAGIPDLIDTRITEKVNEALAGRHVELTWNFGRSLSHVFELPALLEQLRAIGLRAGWGAVRVTDEALVLAVSFHADVIRAPSAPERARQRRNGTRIVT